METNLMIMSKKLSIELSEEQNNKFDTYKKLLIEWNKKINLTAITDNVEIDLKHFIDSMTAIKYIPQNASIIDVGTGAGFPGVVIKLIRQDTKITLLDSLNKRLNFLNEVIKDCQLSNINTVHGRAEDIANMEEYREKYDVSIARAVANLATLTELCLPFVKAGGVFIAMKGNNIDEIDEAKKAIEVLGGKIELVDKFFLPDSDIERNIIIIRKVKNTPKIYPRKAGIPSSKPIK